jgi:hypothetical protein
VSRERVCPCKAPDRWRGVAEACNSLCTDPERLARAMDLLFNLTKAVGEHEAMPSAREWNRAYSEAEDFLEANGRPTSEFSRGDTLP